jgi:hypothetical protein
MTCMVSFGCSDDFIRVPYLGLELTMHVNKSQIHLMKQSLLEGQGSFKKFKNSAE